MLGFCAFDCKGRNAAVSMAGVSQHAGFRYFYRSVRIMPFVVKNRFPGIYHH